MFVNHTNHPSSKWGKTQKEEALKYGSVVDIPFPAIDPEWCEDELNQIIRGNAEKIKNLHPDAVLCQGEFVYAYRMIQELKAKGITVLAASSQRRVIESVEAGVTKKESIFEFVKFREY